MRGTIRALLGLILVLGAAGGLDTATDAQLFGCVAIAIAGLGLMYSGVSAMNAVPAGLSR
jgi:hypothetical protein